MSNTLRPQRVSEPKICIALDAMGGDQGLDIVIHAARRALNTFLNLDLILVGDEKILRDKLPVHPRLRLRHASQHVTMDDSPSKALRFKKDSSMRIALNMVKSGEASACVSAGNTGALMATAKFVLKTLSGIDRPAIITALPSMTGHTHMLDLGANIESSPQHLLQFAVMGAVLAEAVDDLVEPKIALLNIGEEEMKGNDCVKEAAVLLSNAPINYIGFVEGNDIYTGTANVVVCDGFVGNVALKSSEGVAKMISHFAKQSFQHTWFNRFSALVAMPALNHLRKKIDPRRYNGASFLGLQGIVIKSHGDADALAFFCAIHEAVREVEKNVPARISARLTQILDTVKNDI